MKINYLKEYGNDGIVYSQTITIDKNIMGRFNEYITRIKDIRKSQGYSTIYIETLKEGINYVSLITLDYFMNFYIKYIYEPPKKDKTFERILWRNTIINVKECG